MVSKQLELRGALEIDIGIIKELSQLLSRSSQDGVLPFHGFQHGLLKQVPPLRRTVGGWRGGSERLRTLGLSKHEVPADWQNHCRTHSAGQCESDVSTSRRRRRSLRALPWSWDSDSDLEEPVPG